MISKIIIIICAAQFLLFASVFLVILIIAYCKGWETNENVVIIYLLSLVGIVCCINSPYWKK